MEVAVDLLDYLFADFLLVGIELRRQVIDPLVEAVEVHLAELGNVLAVDEVMESHFIESPAVALGACYLAVELLHPLFCAG